MAEHAAVAHSACESGMIRTVVARIHSPGASLLRVPCERQLHQRVAAGAVQIRAYVIAGSDDVVDLLFESVRLFPVEADLIPALVKPSVTLDVGEVALGRLVVKRHGILFITKYIAGCGTTERTAHTRTPVGFRNVRMAIGTQGRVDVPIFS